MIDIRRIRQVMDSLMEGSDFFLVDITAGKGGVQILVDRPSGITIEDCIELTKGLRNKVGEELNEVDLTVSSPGLDMPLKVPAQYKKNTGRDIEVTTTEGRMIKGVLQAADNDGFVLQENRKKMKREFEVVEHRLTYHQVKKVLIIVKFK